VAWLQCEMGTCDSSFVDNVYRPWVAMLPIPQPFYDMVQMGVCCAFTVFNVVPVALGLVGVVTVALAVAALAVAVVQNLVGLALALVAFIHSY